MHMEKKYLIVKIDNVNGGIIADVDNTEVVYFIDSPFKEYLFDEVVRQGKTDVLDRTEFNWSIEVYKLLKQCSYIGYDKIKISVSTGWSDEFTLDEAKFICEAYENRVVSMENLIKKAKEEVKKAEKEDKIVVYTCITGGYDSLMEPAVVTPGVDYVCFTDNPGLKSKNWKIVPMPEELNGLSEVKQQRGVKILAHRYLSDYDISVWVDGAVQVKGNIKEYLKSLDFGKFCVFIPEHPVRKCIYAEKDACIRTKKIKGDGIALAEKQMKRYREEKFPSNYGLVQTNVMMRRHNDPYCKELMEKWWEELKDNSHRDQLSFNYALWKVGDSGFKYLIKTTCNSRVFNWIKSHKKK